jgi:hypothetical protein
MPGRQAEFVLVARELDPVLWSRDHFADHLDVREMCPLGFAAGANSHL